MKKAINDIKYFVKSMLSDETGIVSSKRVSGFLCTISLCSTLILSTFTKFQNKPSDVLIESVTALAFGCLGLTSVEKIWGKKDKTSE